MSTDRAEITKWALALPTAERVQLAQDLWESINGTDPTVATPIDDDLRADLKRRATELDEDTVERFSHDEVMRDARKAIGCD